MNQLVLLAFFSGNMISIGFFISIYFLFVRNENKVRLTLLGLIFLAISLRTIKSIIYFSGGIPDIGVAIGYLGLASIGPLLWLYFKYFHVNTIKTLYNFKNYIHFLPALIGFISISIYGGKVASEFYLYTTFVLFLYVTFSWLKFISFNKKQEKFNTWNLLILIAVTLISLIFIIQHFTDTMINYAIGAVISAIIISSLLLFAIKTPTFFPKTTSKKHFDPILVKKIRSVIEEDKVYKQTSITLDQLAKKLDIPSYLVSRIIKNEYQKTFPETINYYRVKDVISKLNDEKTQQTKIEGLAYSAGFNTPSSFYSAFKKFTGMNPTKFVTMSRKQQQEQVKSFEKDLIPLKETTFKI
ncbi:AraC-like DNA-binding protein [Aquimarina sp. MAR_2010_214]|uniref:helix-turn-helix domain-containing protein n=1 Tax=Aquimarina sp. MAR_2010_214 TaxID=1250026 RepID=UPI000C706506|nr:AraC family transcriptional regulator [Aquimarina sp. MAR_2010_214]PKV51402.1 AraC-like DNA-binding protein [Aquimarina sp. MAR_2010_214]